MNEKENKETDALDVPLAASSEPTQTKNPVHSATQEESSQYVTFSSVLIVMAATVLVTLGAVYLGAMKGYLSFDASTNHQKIVTLDPDRLVEAGFKATQNNAIGGDANADAAKFQAKLKAEIDRLSSHGYIVIHSRAVVANGPNMDVTDDIISRLGLAQTGASK